MKKIKLKINKPFRNPVNKKLLEAGEIIEINACKDGVPLHKYFRDRLNDARKFDNCCEVVSETKKKGKE